MNQGSFVLQRLENAIPTCVSCSQGGFIIAVGYTDERIRILDMRIKGDKQCEFELAGQHSDIVKSVKLSPDGMVCLSAGTDCTFKVWDIGSRRCILTHGGETPLKKLSSFHKDTITAMDVSFEQDTAYTGGRDGSIFKSSLIEHKFSKIH